MNARELTDRLAALLGNERRAMAEFLLALADFDREKRWRELRHASLFVFLRKELRLSVGAAQNRKTAAELIQRYPEVETALRSGELCLSTINELAKVLTEENRHEVLPRFFGLSRREAEALAVSIRPVEVVPVREVVTPIRAPTSKVAAVAVEERRTPASPSGERGTVAFHLDEPAPTVTAPSHLPIAAAPMSSRPDSVEPLDGTVSRFHLTVSRGFLEKLEAAKDALAHAVPDGSAAEILERGLDLLLAEQAKRNGLVAKPRKTPAPSNDASHVPAHVKREVWTRAGGRCEWRFASGERCDCRRKLEFDHVQPLARGGASTIDNIRVLCRPHNLLAARLTLGDQVMDRYTRSGRARGNAAASSQVATGPAEHGRAERPRDATG